MSADSLMDTSWEVCGYHCSQLWGSHSQRAAGVQEEEHGTAGPAGQLLP